jgi:hypothetical protein
MSVGVGQGTSLRRSAVQATNMRLIGGSVTHSRRADDFYPTPPEGTRALLAVEHFEGSILEPACGDGAISRLLIDAGHEVRSTDLIDRGYGEGGLDFLLLGYPYRADNIVTNPPFYLAERFLERALAHSTRKVAMLLKTTFLEGVKRSYILERTPLARVWQFRGRLTFPLPNAADARANGGMFAFAWFIWKHGHKGPPTLGWLPEVKRSARALPDPAQAGLDFGDAA